MLAMMEYGTIKYASSTMSSETLSESCGSRNNRIRTVRLVRPSHGPPAPGLSYRHGPSLGFSIRGGREHGTGIFVSHVEAGSEASTAGLRVGDQIIRINGFAIDDAVHKEVLQLISNHSHLILKVRGVGMIPVKNKISDGLSWQIITTDTDSPLLQESPQLNDKNDVTRINILVAPKSKLGCGICKGPDWKPGIFVQFTQEGGIAREAGLRPGDQILHCNQVDFADINFNEAVSLMKSSKQLQLTVRKGAGSELFPGESSGYNSSASSVTGDQSPSWADSKRLSIVKEELTQLDQFKKNFKKWDSWDEDSEDNKPLFKPTIINLTESGTTIHNNGSQYSFNEEPLYTLPQKTHQKTVAEVHHNHNSETNGHPTLAKSASTSSFGSVASCSNSVASNATSTSLSSAITMEIQRRQKKILTGKMSIDEQLSSRKIFKNTGNSEKQWQHSQLMDEFKKAHRRMFKNCGNEINENSSSSQDRINNNNELTQKLSKRLSELQQTNDCSNGATPPPPPPPPQLVKPLSSTLKKPPAVPVKYSVLSSPPPCPTPDYDTLSLSSSSTSSHTHPINKRILSKSQSETSTIRRGGRPVSVTIGEYPSMRREVGKLDFLQSTKKTSGGAVNDRLTNELTQTLNRSNLKKRTESMENLIEQQRNGTVRINLNKSTNDLTNDYITINVNKNKSITFADE